MKFLWSNIKPHGYLAQIRRTTIIIKKPTRPQTILQLSLLPLRISMSFCTLQSILMRKDVMRRQPFSWQPPFFIQNKCQWNRESPLQDRKFTENFSWIPLDLGKSQIDSRASEIIKQSVIWGDQEVQIDEGVSGEERRRAIAWWVHERYGLLYLNPWKIEEGYRGHQ